MSLPALRPSRAGFGGIWGSVVEDELRDSEAVEKVRETGGSGMIICEILFLFAYIYCTLFLLPLVWWSRTQIEKAGIIQRQG